MICKLEVSIIIDVLLLLANFIFSLDFLFYQAIKSNSYSYNFDQIFLGKIQHLISLTYDFLVFLQTLDQSLEYHDTNFLTSKHQDQLLIFLVSK